jgi:hypothetical protein
LTHALKRPAIVSRKIFLFLQFGMKNDVSSWSVAIIAARESAATLSRCINAALAACGSRAAVVDVLINGNSGLAQQTAALAAQGAFACGTSTLQIWSTPAGDKAHAWNQYVHDIWPGGDIAFFVDGYAEVRPDAFAALNDRLAAAPDALAVTGVPSSGRSAGRQREYMLRHGGFHGNMHALSGVALEALRKKGIRLPLGLYRTDSLIGAALLFKLAPESARWDTSRVVVAGDATWDVPGLAALTLENIVSQVKRMLRQAQGDLENRAVREHLSVQRLPLEQLPATTHELVNRWVSSQRGQAWRMYLRNPFRLHAAYKLRRGRDWSQAEHPPALLHSTGLRSAQPAYKVM